MALISVMFITGWKGYSTFVRLSRPQPANNPSELTSDADNVPVDLASVRPATRPVYPYSVIRGGVYNAVELKNALRTDSVAAAHYAGFNSADVRTVQLTEPRRVYVSFRKDDRIYWTRNPILLAQGETVLSDGVNEARARCGNRMSVKPEGPVLPEDPPADTWEKPVDAAAPPPDSHPVDPAHQPLPVADVFAPPNLPAIAAAGTGGSTSTAGSIDPPPLPSRYLPASMPATGLLPAAGTAIPNLSGVPPAAPPASSPLSPIDFSAPTVPQHVTVTPQMVIVMAAGTQPGPSTPSAPPSPVPSPALPAPVPIWTPATPTGGFIGIPNVNSTGGKGDPGDPNDPGNPGISVVTTSTISTQQPNPDSPSPIPEPASLLLIGAGVVAILALRR